MYLYILSKTIFIFLEAVGASGLMGERGELYMRKKFKNSNIFHISYFATCSMYVSLLVSLNYR